jgi:hypothetical protein
VMPSLGKQDATAFLNRALVGENVRAPVAGISRAARRFHSQRERLLLRIDGKSQ